MTEPAIQTLAIVGASGQMGQVFSQAFTDQGCDVVPLDRPFSKAAIREALTDCDMLLLSVPVTAMDSVLDHMTPHLNGRTILCDVGSVKIHPMKTMIRRYQGPVVGTHPLFGPILPDEFTPRIAIAPGRETDRDAASAVSRLMQSCGYECFSTTAEEHDRAMAFVQGLNFTSTVAFLAAARDVDGIDNFITPSFKRRLDSAHKMLTQDTELFETISESNPFLQEVNRKFMAYLSLAAGGDLDLLADRAQWWWHHETP
ncbi:prephenate dehydrogenase/arogenate dehydrogenase family protein [Pseudodesulfovibrio sp. JC047]|uniref:prephenate dehydrogenase/arogenate dehydrogenase family protein n=1 Tax=Pseudodesulfovibrio sp. JC047 TaxID=2683199 RepID=UPI0013D19BC2|nr:prephenate dehydrogenase/arogenate dehydrogenase family protein [Pseudodesulfovibrio sp. JC047]NDV19384.1 prephenate dehydrogenase/arogenate dehydrogenase family protein [Pseudodesulfovibrio sp. JC047]